MYVNYNPNPVNARVGDCVIRAISKVLNQDWVKTYTDLCVYGIMMCDLPSANNVWGRYLRDKGFTRKIVPDTNEIYTVKMFSDDHNKGIYVLALNGHVVALEDGNYFDTWNSGDEVPVYYWTKKKEE